MSLWKIAWRSIQQRGLSSLLTAISIGLGVGLVVAVLVIHAVIDQSFRRGSQGYDVLVGPKGDKLQLVLDTVFHLSEPVPSTIPYKYYLEFSQGRFSPSVAVAVPVCTGHDYRNCRAVATTPDMFDELTYLDGRKYRFSEGRNFKAENYFEAVVGSVAARRAGLKVGDKFKPTAPSERTDEGHGDFTVVGILAPTGTPNDRAIFLNIEGFWRCDAHRHGPSFGERVLRGAAASPPASHGAAIAAEPGSSRPEASHNGDHGESEHHELTDDEKRVSAILIASDMSRPDLAMALPSVVNNEPVAQAVQPVRVIADLFDGIVGNVQLLLLILAVLVIVVAGIGMMVSIYNSMNDRRREIAIMRALGASRLMVMAIILVESIILSLGGGLIGLVLGHGLIGLLSGTIAEQTGVMISAAEFKLIELILIPGLIAMASVVGYVPALVAYRTDVAKSLTD